MIAAGHLFTCAVLSPATAVKCFGAAKFTGTGSSRQQGHSSQTIGDDMLPVQLNMLPGDKIVYLAAQSESACAIVQRAATNAGSSLQCWGYNVYGSVATDGSYRPSTTASTTLRAKYFYTPNIRDADLTPDFEPVGIAMGYDVNCIWSRTGDVKCWGMATQSTPVGFSTYTYGALLPHDGFIFPLTPGTPRVSIPTDKHVVKVTISTDRYGTWTPNWGVLSSNTAYALCQDGTIFYWESSERFEIHQTLPSVWSTGTLNKVVDIAATSISEKFCVALEDGTVKCVMRNTLDVITVPINNGQVEMESTCEVCPLNHYCPGSGDTTLHPCTSCSIAEHMVDTCTTITDAVCVPCPSGFFCTNGNASSSILPCPIHHWCSNNIINQCPLHTSSPKNSSIQQDCLCNSGYYGTPGGLCQECTVDHWCPGGGPIYQCPPNSTSLHVSADEVSDCQCDPGFENTNPNATTAPICTPCQNGQYCQGGIPNNCPDPIN
eukprot:2384109-Rhodomonas_salina.1